jgi:hypothetical protein
MTCKEIRDNLIAPEHLLQLLDSRRQIAEQHHYRLQPNSSTTAAAEHETGAALTSTCWMVACSSAMLQLSVTRTLLQQLPSWRFTTTQLGRITLPLQLPALPLPPPSQLLSATLLRALAALLRVLLPAAAPPVNPCRVAPAVSAAACIAPAAVLAGNGLLASLRCCSRAMMLARVLCASTISGCIWQGAGPGWQR